MIHLVFLFLTDDKSTLLVAFQVPTLKRHTTTLSYLDFVMGTYPVMPYLGGTDSSDPITGILMEKLTSFPTAPKLVVTPTRYTHPSKELEEIPECLHVEYKGEEALSTILEVLSKRWQTRDLISIIREAQRSVPNKRGNSIKDITENLSAIPRFQLTPEQS